MDEQFEREYQEYVEQDRIWGVVSKDRIRMCLSIPKLCKRARKSFAPVNSEYLEYLQMGPQK